jgi:hypothetical protein
MPRVPPVTMTVRPVMSNRRSNVVRSTGSVKQTPLGRHVVHYELTAAIHKRPDDERGPTGFSRLAPAERQVICGSHFAASKLLEVFYYQRKQFWRTMFR